MSDKKLDNNKATEEDRKIIIQKLDDLPPEAIFLILNFVEYTAHKYGVN